MKKLTAITFLFLLVGLMSACSKDNQTNATAGDSKTTTVDTTATAGDVVFQKSCITCHSSGDLTGGQVKLDSAKIHNDFKQEADLTSFVQTNMPKSAPGSLSKEESEAVSKYLWDQKQ